MADNKRNNLENFMYFCTQTLSSIRFGMDEPYEFETTKESIPFYVDVNKQTVSLGGYETPIDLSRSNEEVLEQLQEIGSNSVIMREDIALTEEQFELTSEKMVNFLMHSAALESVNNREEYINKVQSIAKEGEEQLAEKVLSSNNQLMLNYVDIAIKANFANETANRLLPINNVKPGEFSQGKMIYGGDGQLTSVVDKDVSTKDKFNDIPVLLFKEDKSVYYCHGRYDDKGVLQEAVGNMIQLVAPGGFDQVTGDLTYVPDAFDKLAAFDDSPVYRLENEINQALGNAIEKGKLVKNIVMTVVEGDTNTPAAFKFNLEDMGKSDWDSFAEKLNLTSSEFEVKSLYKDGDREGKVSEAVVTIPFNRENLTAIFGDTKYSNPFLNKTDYESALVNESEMKETAFYKNLVDYCENAEKGHIHFTAHNTNPNENKDVKNLIYTKAIEDEREFFNKDDIESEDTKRNNLGIQIGNNTDRATSYKVVSIEEKKPVVEWDISNLKEGIIIKGLDEEAAKNLLKETFGKYGYEDRINKFIDEQTKHYALSGDPNVKAYYLPIAENDKTFANDIFHIPDLDKSSTWNQYTKGIETGSLKGNNENEKKPVNIYQEALTGYILGAKDVNVAYDITTSADTLETSREKTIIAATIGSNQSEMNLSVNSRKDELLIRNAVGTVNGISFDLKLHVDKKLSVAKDANFEKLVNRTSVYEHNNGQFTLENRSLNHAISGDKSYMEFLKPYKDTKTNPGHISLMIPVVQTKDGENVGIIAAEDKNNGYQTVVQPIVLPEGGKLDKNGRYYSVDITDINDQGLQYEYIDMPEEDKKQLYYSYLEQDSVKTLEEMAVNNNNAIVNSIDGKAHFEYIQTADNKFYIPLIENNEVVIRLSDRPLTKENDHELGIILPVNDVKKMQVIEKTEYDTQGLAYDRNHSVSILMKSEDETAKKYAKGFLEALNAKEDLSGKSLTDLDKAERDLTRRSGKGLIAMIQRGLHGETRKAVLKQLKVIEAQKAFREANISISTLMHSEKFTANLVGGKDLTDPESIEIKNELDSSLNSFFEAFTRAASNDDKFFMAYYEGNTKTALSMQNGEFQLSLRNPGGEVEVRPVSEQEAKNILETIVISKSGVDVYRNELIEKRELGKIAEKFISESGINDRIAKSIDTGIVGDTKDGLRNNDITKEARDLILSTPNDKTNDTLKEYLATLSGPRKAEESPAITTLRKNIEVTCFNKEKSQATLNEVLAEFGTLAKKERELVETIDSFKDLAHSIKYGDTEKNERKSLENELAKVRDKKEMVFDDKDSKFSSLVNQVADKIRSNSDFRQYMELAGKTNKINSATITNIAKETAHTVAENIVLGKLEELSIEGIKDCKNREELYGRVDTIIDSFAKNITIDKVTISALEADKNMQKELAKEGPEKDTKTDKDER